MEAIELNDLKYLPVPNMTLLHDDDNVNKSPISSTASLQENASNSLDIEIEDNQKPSRLVIILTLVSSISGFMFGYDTGYISSALVNIGTDLGGVLSTGDKEFITSATSLGALFGAIASGILANIIGRKKVLLGSNVVFVVGTIIQLCSKTVWTMIIGRFILGWGVGIASLISPLMLSELAPSRYRGRLIVTNVLFITGGQLIAYFINWGLTHVKHGWRVSVGLCMVPPVIQFVLFWFLPDTPRFYIMNNEVEKAREVLHRTHIHASPAYVNAIIDDMIASNSVVPGNSPMRQAINSIKIIHTKPANFRALILACGLQGIQQFTGFNSLMYFSATIFETIGFDNPTAVSIIIAASNFVFTCVALLIIDKVGRRKILLVCMPIMVVAMVVCAIAFHYLGVKFSGNSFDIAQRGITGWGVVVIISMVLFVAGYATGIGNSAWAGVELFSDVNVRAIGGMYAAATNWSGSLVIASTFLTMLENITPTGTFALFGALCAVSFFFVLFLLPETAGLELEETTLLLNEGFNVKESIRLSKARKRMSKFSGV